MTETVCLAVDAMGGDFGPRLVIPAVIKFLQRHPQLRIIAYGDSGAIAPFLGELPGLIADRLEVVHCHQQVDMDEKPSAALRHKRESSLWHAVAAVADGRAGACVSAGNTGALMAMGMAALNTLPGISRPAICTSLPTLKGHSYLLDMGANLQCRAEQLYQFALMAVQKVSAVDGKSSPRVGLLNVGREAVKGNEEIHEAAKLLTADAEINYGGYVEGDGIFSGDFDIVVCDGFAGNIALKTSEGVARMIDVLLRDSFSKSFLGKLFALFHAKVLRGLRQRIDPSLYNGASFLGLQGVVVKSHGGANIAGLLNAFEVALDEVQKNVPDIISNSLRDNELVANNLKT